MKEETVEDMHNRIVRDIAKIILRSKNPLSLLQRIAAGEKTYSNSISPKGSRTGDVFGCVRVRRADERSDCWAARIGARQGDSVIFYLTDDVKDNDIALVVDANEKTAAIGKLRLTNTGFEIDEERFDRGEAEIRGRAAEIQRDGERVSPKIKLRPVHSRKTKAAAARAIEEQLDNVKVSIVDGQLLVTSEKGGAR